MQDDTEIEKWVPANIREKGQKQEEIGSEIPGEQREGGGKRCYT